MLLITLLGCALHTSRAGLIERLGDVTRLRTYEGQTWILHLDEEGQPVRYLHDCVVEVEGARFGRGVWVKDWFVRDAGDGSGGFVGELRAYGSRLVIDDRNTGTTLLVDDLSAMKLRGLEGHNVLLIGHVIGGGKIEVVAWRVLAPGEP